MSPEVAGCVVPDSSEDYPEMGRKVKERIRDGTLRRVDRAGATHMEQTSNDSGDRHEFLLAFD
jgi:hypothetical protein